MNEPLTIAFFLAATGLLLGASALVSRASGRVGVPFALLFLLVGMLAGSEGLGGIQFHNYSLAFRLGTVALVLILFDGGLNTPMASIRLVLKPAAVLATAGVVGTAGLVAVAAWWWGVSWPHAMLLGAVVSSTDAAAVFGVLRGGGVQLRQRLGLTLELESGINDPSAIILTMALTEALVSGEPLGWSSLLLVTQQLVGGLVGGFAFGYFARWLLRRVHLPASGLYPVMMLAFACLAYGIPAALGGSGFLAVYVAGVVLGNGPLPMRSGLLRVHDALAWLSQVGMFLLLGLLVFPSRLIEAAPLGLFIALVLAFLARPLVVAACLAPFRYPLKETLYIGWIGLRGAVPIILATFPVLSNAPGAERLFDVVFFIVVVNALVPGATVRRVTEWLGFEEKRPPAPSAVLEITSLQDLEGQVLSFFVDKAATISGATIADVPFPEGAAVMLIVRGHTLVAARGMTQLLPGDHVYVFCKEEDAAFVRLLFGREEVG